MEKQMKFLFEQFNMFEGYDIVCVSNDMQIIDYDKGRIKKSMKNYFKSSDYDNGIKSNINVMLNSSMVPMGEKYNLIGIDIDNKEDTLETWERIFEYVGTPTFTVKTINKGFHYYYRLTDEQKQLLKNVNFSQSQGQLFGLHIDVKYEHAFLFGPTYLPITESQARTYEVINDRKPAILPMAIFQEIYDNELKKIPSPFKANKKEKTKEIVEEKGKGKEERIIQLLDCLKQNRCDKRDEWLKVGAILFNEGYKFEIFDEWSKKSNKYDKNACRTLWKSFNEERDKKLKIGSLYLMAKEDNYEEFRKIITSTPIEIINEIYKNGGIDDVSASKLFHSLYKDNFIYDSDNKDWYSFNEFGIYSKSSNECIDAKKLINGFLHLFETDYMKRSANTQDESVKTMLAKCYVQIRNFLGKTKNKDNICNELKLIYAQKGIYEKMDQVNQNIIGFKNGVYDLENREFRKGKPEELVSCTTAYEYEDKKGVKNEIDILNGLLKKILPNSSERKYLLKTLSLGLYGRNPLEDVYIWIGSGGNGKGLLLSLLKSTLGEYFGSMDIGYLSEGTAKVAPGQADPILANKKNCRLVSTTEPEGGVRLKQGKIKSISGRDALEVRELYKTNFTFVPGFSIIIQTNEKLEFDGTDGGMKRRLKLLRFPIKFVDNPTKENESKIDRTLKDQFEQNEKFKVALFHILLDHYFLFIDESEGKNELPMPERFQNETDEFFADNDPVQSFLDEACEITRSDKDQIPSTDFYRCFQTYCQDNARNNYVTVQKFKEILKNKNIELKKTKKCNVYCRIKLVKEEQKDLFVNRDPLDENMDED